MSPILAVSTISGDLVQHCLRGPNTVARMDDRKPACLYDIVGLLSSLDFSEAAKNETNLVPIMPSGVLTLTIAPPGAGPEDKDMKITVTDLHPTNTVEHLKRVIAEKARRPHEWSNIILYFQSKLEDSETLEKCGIEDVGDEIKQAGPFALHPQQRKPASASSKPHVSRNWSRPKVDGPQIINLPFKHFDGQTFMLNDIPVKYTVKQLKEVLWYEKDIDMDWIRLIYGGKQFEDRNTLEHYHVRENATIMIVARLKGGRFVMVD